MKYTLFNACTDRETQREAAALLGRIFPDYWEQTAARNQEFPFEEISFTARAENGLLCGHAGIIPFSVSDGKGGALSFAGIASVAVDPAFRREGIASALCERAAEWAQRQGFDALPLFTGKYGVYAGHGWKKYAVDAPQRVVSPAEIAPRCRILPAARLSDSEKEAVITFYEKSADFPGKVKRGSGNAFHSWKRIFREPEFEFAVSPEGCALLWGGAVVELCTLPGAEEEVLASLGISSFTLALPAGHPAWRSLEEKQWKKEGVPDDVYHGEGVMVRPVKAPLPEGISFPCADKF